jgi:hypothetical protein
VYSLYNNTSGNKNTSGGVWSMYNNVTGNNNSAFGYNALFSNTTGYSNVAIGTGALYKNIEGSNMVAVGDSALYNQNDHVSFSQPDRNTAVGSKALYSNTNGSFNTASGYKSLYSNTDGNGNTASGLQSLFSNTEGDGNTALGDLADVTTGNLSNATALGSAAKVNASNKVRIGDGFVTVVESHAGSWTVSDARFKINIKEEVKGLKFIKLLRPVVYNFDTKKYEEFLMQIYPDSIKKRRMEAIKNTSSKASEIRQSGFVAQEVQEAAKKTGYDFNGVHAPENPTDNWSLSYEKLVVPLVKAVQELSKINDEKDTKISNLEARLAKLETMMKKMPIAMNDQ